jgi:hypothetical protein
MATKFKEGDLVEIVTREPNAEDGKSGLYYAHFGGLRGHIQKVYTSGEVAIEIDLPSLPEEVSKRHEEMRLQMQNKWLDGLSEEGRNRLSDAEKQFRLRYNVLVGQDDITAPKALSKTKEETPRRLTSADLEAREAEELAKRQK